MADYNYMNAGDFSGAPEFEYVSKRAKGGSIDLNWDGNRRCGATDTIIRNGIEYRVTCYYSFATTSYMDVAISKNRGAWEIHRITSFVPNGSLDAHYACYLGVDNDGIIHTVFNIWGDPLNYYRSLEPVESFDGTWTSVQDFSAGDETLCEYAYLVRGRNNCGFYAMVRKGISGNADQHMYSWNGSAWSNAAGSSTDGLVYEGTTGDTYNAYVSPPVFTPDWDGAGTGYMYQNGSWFDNDPTTPTSYRLFCHRWDGTTWEEVDGTSQTVPITFDNCSIVHDGTAGNRLNAIHVVELDSNDRPHMPYLYGATDRHIYHAHWNGSAWVSNLALTATGLDYEGYPDIVVTEDDTAVIIYRDLNSETLKRIKSDGTDYTTWGSPSELSATTIPHVCVPLHDRYMWDEYKEYVMPVPIPATARLYHNTLSYYWSMDESGNKFDMHTGTAFTNNGSTTVAGLRSNAARFASASSHYLDRADFAGISPTGSFSFSANIRFTTLNSFNHIITKYGAAGQRTFLLSATTGTPNIFTWTVSTDGTATTACNTSATVAPTTGQWYHVVCVCDVDTDELRLYIDGTLAASTAFTGTPFDSTAAMRLGVAATGSSYFNGDIDEFSFFNGTALDADDAAFLYNAAAARDYRELALVAPSIWSHGATATVNCTAGDTPSVTVAAWGDLPMSEGLTGTDAASYDVVDNADGTWTITRDSAISAGDEEVTLTLTNDAGTDAVDLTFSAAGAPSAPVNTVAPAVTGTEANGKTLTSTTGTWTGADSYAYQWYANTAASTSGGSAIGGATASTHVLTDSQDDLYVYCVVTASNEEGSDSEPSNVVGPILGLNVVVKANPTFADAADFQDQTLINEAVGDDGAGEEMPAPSTWETDSPVGDVDWSAFTLAVDAATINRSNRAGATLISPNYVVLAAHAPGDNTGHTWMTPAGAEVTRTLGSTPDVDYWELGTGDLALAKLSAPINNITPMPMILDSSKVAGLDGLAIEMDRHLNVFTIPESLDNTDEDCTISHSRASDGLESGDSGKPFVIIIDDTAVMVITAMYTASPGGPPFTGTGPNASHFIDEIFAITAEDGESPTVWDLRSGDDGAVSGNPGSSPTGQVTSSPTNMPISLLRKYHANAR